MSNQFPSISGSPQPRRRRATPAVRDLLIEGALAGYAPARAKQAQ